MPKIIKSKKRKTRKPKPKKTYDVIMPGKDLKMDVIGTEQLLRENDINTLIQSGNLIFDKDKLKQYKKNLKEQKQIQIYGGNPIINAELIKQSHILYDQIKNSLFKSEEDEQIYNEKVQQNKKIDKMDKLKTPEELEEKKQMYDYNKQLRYQMIDYKLKQDDV